MSTELDTLIYYLLFSLLDKNKEDALLHIEEIKAAVASGAELAAEDLLHMVVTTVRDMADQGHARDIILDDSDPDDDVWATPKSNEEQDKPN